MSRAVREWPLVAFTLLAQLAVGAFLSLGAVRLALLGRVPSDALDTMLSLPLLVVGGVFSIALVLSAGHLARPAAAYLAVRNAANSWVSLEIVLAGGFWLAWAGYLLLRMGGDMPEALTGAVAALAAMLGLGMVYAMGRIYRLPTRPGWNHPVTSLAFFLSAGVSGPFTAVALLLPRGYQAVGAARQFPERLLALDGAVRMLLLAGACCSVLEAGVIVWMALVRTRAAQGGSLFPESARSLRRARHVAFVRVFLVLIAGGIAAGYLVRTPPLSGAEPLAAMLVVGALGLVVVESVLGRIEFYREGTVAAI